MENIFSWSGLKDILMVINWGYILTLLAIIVTIYLHFRNKKRLSYEVLKNTSLLTHKESVQNKIQVLYEGYEVQDITFLEIRIVNNGNIAISKDDFEEDLIIKFGEEIQIFSCETIETNPKDIFIDIHAPKNEIQIMPLLLNQNDSFTLKIIISGRNADFSICSRIKDVTRITKIKNYSNMLFLLSLVGVLIGGILVSEKDKFFPWQRENFGTKEMIGYLTILLGYVGAIYAIKKNKKEKRNFRNFFG